eukprot:g463.t1
MDNIRCSGCEKTLVKGDWYVHFGIDYGVQMCKLCCARKDPKCFEPTVCTQIKDAYIDEEAELSDDNPELGVNESTWYIVKDDIDRQKILSMGYFRDSVTGPVTNGTESCGEEDAVLYVQDSGACGPVLTIFESGNIRAKCQQCSTLITKGDWIVHWDESDSHEMFCRQCSYHKNPSRASSSFMPLKYGFDQLVQGIRWRSKKMNESGCLTKDELGEHTWLAVKDNADMEKLIAIVLMDPFDDDDDDDDDEDDDNGEEEEDGKRDEGKNRNENANDDDDNNDEVDRKRPLPTKEGGEAGSRKHERLHKRRR